MAVHQLKKLAQSRNKGAGRSLLVDAVTRQWSTCALLFITLFLLLFCFLALDIRTLPTALLLHASSQFNALRAQAGELYSGKSSSEVSVQTNFVKGRPLRGESKLSDEEGEENSLMGKSSEELTTLMDDHRSDKLETNQATETDHHADEERQGKKDPLNLRQKTVKPNNASEGEVVPGYVGEGGEKTVTSGDVVSRDPKEGNVKHDKEKTHQDEKVMGTPRKSTSSASDPVVLQEVIIDGKCDYSVGHWVYDESYPLYKPDTCPFVDGGFRCVENGRPSAEFQKYRWQPAGCNLPRFDPVNMLEKLRGRRLAFVGDSIGRNNWESLLCMLSDVVTNKSRVFEINGESISKHQGFLSFKFEDYNCTIEYYRSPYLVPQGRAPPNSPPVVHSTFKLDQIDWYANQWKMADILILNAGHWWSYEKTIRGGNYFQVENKVKMEMEVGDAFAMAMRTVARYIDENVDPRRTQVFWRSYAPVHFRGGTWKTGGSCHLEQTPIPNISDYKDPSFNQMVYEVMSENKRTPITFLNVTYASDHRADGHSSVWQRYPPAPLNKQDCSHWCLPGVPDTWNEFLYAALLNRRQGPWGEGSV